MNKNVCYKMRAEDPDPRNSGDTHSWFFFYKWRAGETWVPAKEGCEHGQVGDVLVFEMDGVEIGGALIMNVVERNLEGEKELHFDSDQITIPTHAPTDRLGSWEPHIKLADIKEGEEPSWLKSLLTRKPK